MTQTPSSPASAPSKEAPVSDAKKDRLASALRKNLLRRKAASAPTDGGKDA